MPKNSILLGGNQSDHQRSNSASDDGNEAIGNEWELVQPVDGRRDDSPERRTLNQNAFIGSISNAGATASNTAAAAGGGGGDRGRGNVFQHDTDKRTGGVYKSSKGGYYPGPYPPSPTPPWPQWPGPHPPIPTGGHGHRPHYNPRPPRPR